MAWGLQINERMAGWVRFLPRAAGTPLEPLQEGYQYPFEITLHAFTSQLLRFPLALKFLGVASFPGLPVAPDLPESVTHPEISGSMMINPLKGVSYRGEFTLPHFGKIELEGAKKYQFFTLSWSRLRASLVTLPFELRQDGVLVGQGEISYLEPLWHFPFGLRLIPERWGHHPYRRLATRLASLGRVTTLQADRYSTLEERIDKIETHFSAAKTVTCWVTWCCWYLLTIYCLMRFHKSIARLDSEECELLARTMASSSLWYILTLPLMIPVGSTIFGSKAYRESKDQHIPLPPKNVEPERWMELCQTPSRQLGEQELEVDVVVVGSGAGGGAAAYELARRGLAVAIVEEGHYFKRMDMGGDRETMLAKLYRDGGQTFAYSNAPLWLPTGKCVGGTTTINCGTSIRTPQAVMDRWEKELALKVDLNPYFPEVEKMLDVKPVPLALQGGIAEVLAAGLKGRSLQMHALPRSETGCDGQGYCFLGCPINAKRSTDVSYIPEAMKNNAYLFTHYKVAELLREGNRVTGIRAWVENYEKLFPLTIRARAVVLAGGAFSTPFLLKKNGFDSAHLGHHLTIHPAISFGALFSRPVRPKMFVPQALGVFDLPNDHFVLEGYTFTSDTLVTALSHYGQRLQEAMDRLENMVTFSAILKDAQEGRLCFSTSQASPVYRFNDATVERMREATLLMLEIFFGAGALQTYSPIKGFELLKNSHALESLKRAKLSARQFTVSAHHPLGTCRMGSSAHNSVIDPMGKVWGCENLYVVDGSAIPGPLGVNPQVTIMANSTRIARQLGEQLK